jgi:A/G-specific adenine glycosylase
VIRHEWRSKELRRRLLRWFAREGRVFPWRDPSASKYVLMVSEVLLQRTRAETVAAFFPRFVERFPGWSDLARATEEELGTFLQPIGLWRRRAVSLRALASEMQSRRGRCPTGRDEIEALPGVGQYVANAAMVFHHGAREPLLDANMARVLERCFAPRKLVDIRYDPWLQTLARAVVNHSRVREINWAVLDLASAICLPRAPRCNACPLQSCCVASRNGRSPDERQVRRPPRRRDVVVGGRRPGGPSARP